MVVAFSIGRARVGRWLFLGSSSFPGVALDTCGAGNTAVSFVLAGRAFALWARSCAAFACDTASQAMGTCVVANGEVPWARLVGGLV